MAIPDHRDSRVHLIFRQLSNHPGWAQVFWIQGGRAPVRGGAIRPCLFPDGTSAIRAEGGLVTHVRPREDWTRKTDLDRCRGRVRLDAPGLVLVYPWNSSPGTGLGLSHPSSFSGARRAFGHYHPGVGKVNVGMGLRCQLQWPRRPGPRCEEAGPILTGWRLTGRSCGPILFPSQSARRRLGGTLFEKACLTRSEWGPTGQPRGHRQLLPRSDGGPRLRGRNHSLFRTLSQVGEAPGRVPGCSPTSLYSEPAP